MTKKTSPTRRQFVLGTAATAGLAAAGGLVPMRLAAAAKAPVKVGILLPYSGTYAMLGNHITNALKMRIEQAGGMLGGRPIEYVAIDSEMSVPKAPRTRWRQCRRPSGIRRGTSCWSHCRGSRHSAASS